jgi:hypothetical protein
MLLVDPGRCRDKLVVTSSEGKTVDVTRAMVFIAPSNHVTVELSTCNRFSPVPASDVKILTEYKETGE